jgi:hypothetical protein
MLQNHPSDSFDKKLNFWEEFPTYKIHPILGDIWKLNKKSKSNLENSSNFMWVLSLCYDRKSAIFSQPELDKWEVTCEDLMDDDKFMFNLIDDIQDQTKVIFESSLNIRLIIDAFEKSIDSPLGISLRLLESKLIERTQFIHSTKYTLDEYETKGQRQVLKKGTADQLDKMFANTDKINSLVQGAMSTLENSVSSSSNKGGGEVSMGDHDPDF